MHIQNASNPRTYMQLVFSEHHHDPPEISSVAGRLDEDPLNLDVAIGKRNRTGYDKDNWMHRGRRKLLKPEPLSGLDAVTTPYFMFYMDVLVWNCNGAASRSFIRTLKDLIHKYKPVFWVC